MNRKEEIRSAVLYTVIMLTTFFVMQAVVILLHEFTHSITAHLLGVMPDPFGIVWGNSITMTGWDEGVRYSQLWATGRDLDGAITGVMPLVVHTIIITCGLILLLSGVLRKHKWGFHLVFWFIVANMMELFAYMPMRAFASNGDTGNFNHGMGLSPWVLLIPGTILVLLLLYYLLLRTLPGMYVVVAEGSRTLQYLILYFFAFAIFIWGSGLRVVLYIYPDPQWLLGLIGFGAFFVAIWLCRPGMPWVVRAEKQFGEGLPDRTQEIW
ncbi:MAG: hypothetical protein WC586_03005 [Methanoregula sp.]